MKTVPLFDLGLQPERTILAWRRTAISVALGSVVALRVLPASFGDPVWYAAGLAGMAFAAWIWWAAWRRGAAFARQVAEGGAEPASGGGGVLLALAVTTAALGLVALAAVMMGAGR